MPPDQPEASPILPASRGALSCKALLVPLLLCVSLPGQAQGPSRVKDYLISINRLYEDLEYEQALEQIGRARRFSSTAQEDVTLSLYEGIILADMSRREAAVAAFRRALSLDPTAVLPVKVSPKVVQLFEELRSKTPSAPLSPRAPTGSSGPGSPNTPERAQASVTGVRADGTGGCLHGRCV